MNEVIESLLSFAIDCSEGSTVVVSKQLYIELLKQKTMVQQEHSNVMLLFGKKIICDENEEFFREEKEKGK